LCLAAGQAAVPRDQIAPHRIDLAAKPRVPRTIRQPRAKHLPSDRAKANAKRSILLCLG
jgi:hypothetical protein